MKARDVRAIEDEGVALGMTRLQALRMALVALGKGPWAESPADALAALGELGKDLRLSGPGVLRWLVLRALAGRSVRLGDRAVGSVPARLASVLDDPAYAAWCVARHTAQTNLDYSTWKTEYDHE